MSTLFVAFRRTHHQAFTQSRKRRTVYQKGKTPYPIIFSDAKGRVNALGVGCGWVWRPVFCHSNVKMKKTKYSKYSTSLVHCCSNASAAYPRMPLFKWCDSSTKKRKKSMLKY